MNTAQHTVTVPLDDYFAMVAAAKKAETDVAAFRARVIQALVDQKLKCYNPEGVDFLNRLIAAVENCK